MRTAVQYLVRGEAHRCDVVLDLVPFRRFLPVDLVILPIQFFVCFARLVARFYAIVQFIRGCRALTEIIPSVRLGFLQEFPLVLRRSGFQIVVLGTAGFDLDVVQRSRRLLLVVVGLVVSGHFTTLLLVIIGIVRLILFGVLLAPDLSQILRTGKIGFVDFRRVRTRRPSRFRYRYGDVRLFVLVGLG